MVFISYIRISGGTLYPSGYLYVLCSIPCGIYILQRCLYICQDISYKNLILTHGIPHALISIDYHHCLIIKLAQSHVAVDFLTLDCIGVGVSCFLLIIILVPIDVFLWGQTCRRIQTRITYKGALPMWVM